MRKLVAIVLLGLMLACLVAVPVFAEGEDNATKTLEEVVNKNAQEVQSQTQQTTPQPSQPAPNTDTTTQKNSIDRGKDIIKDLGRATDMTEKMPEVEKAGSGIKRIMTILVQIISYVITFGLVLRVAIDLMFIGLPFTRGFLANGYTGNPQAGAGGMPTPSGMTPGMGAGIGMPGTGYGGFGGYGYHRPFGSSPFGTSGMTNPAMQGSGFFGRIQWVSNAALNAVAAETTIGSDGRPVSPLKVYAKDMMIVLVLTPILLVLAVTGVLTQLGFMLGELISNVLRSFGGSLGA